MPPQFYVDKANGTFSDPLIAFGLATVLRELLDAQRGGSIHIEDRGCYYEIACDPMLEAAAVEQCRLLAPADMIRTIKNSATIPDSYPRQRVIDYEAQKQQRNTYLEFLQKTRGGRNLPADQQPPPPHPHWDIFRAINPAALPGYNNLMSDWWKTRAALPQVLDLLLRLFSHTPNNLDAAMREWKALDKTNGWGIDVETTTLQLYNPDQGKGQNRAKANALGMGNVKGFWLLEWLKAVGFCHAALTRTLKGVKDRKTYVLAPINLDYDESGSILKQFQTLMQVNKPAITSDILAAIHYARAMLQHAAEHEDFYQILLGLERPRNVVRGFYTAFYKDLGNAVATMNLSFIALPGWITVRSADDVEEAQKTITELEQLTWTLDETHSDAYTLLSHLRDFISGDDLDAFFTFTNAHAAYLIGRRERNQPARQLTTDFIRSVVVGTEEKLSPILDSDGFKNIAYAIRQSTVTAQYRKKQHDRRYDVRYGLGQELARKARYPGEFVTALTDFLHKYNAENAQVMETRSGPYRRNVQTTDIEEIVALIDQYGAPLIASLLIAYGYARLPYEGDSQENVEAAQDSLESIETDTDAPSEE